MRLLPRADGLGRVPAVEVMIATNYIRECIENKEKTKYITDAIKAGTSQYGMQTFDQSLFQLYKTGLITLEEAIRRSTNPNEFKLKVQDPVDVGHAKSSWKVPQAPDGSGQGPFSVDFGTIDGVIFSSRKGNERAFRALFWLAARTRGPRFARNSF